MTGQWRLLLAAAVLLVPAARGRATRAAVDSSIGQNAECTDMRVAVFDAGIQVGDLYDGTKHATIAGLSLWTTEQLKKYTETNRSMSTKYETLISNEISKKADFLGVSATLALDIVCGAAYIHIDGSGKFLKKNEKSYLQSSVAARATTSTHYKRMLPELVHDITYPYMTGTEYATHVVTRVDYGSNLVMQFTQTSSSDAEAMDVEAHLKGTLTMTWGSVSAGGNVTINKTQKALMEKTQVEVFAQVKLTEFPVNMEQAVRLVQKLPEEMYDMEKTVPRFATMLPIRCLPDQAERRMLIQIHKNILDDLLARMQGHVDTQLGIERLTRQPNYAMFEGIKSSVHDYEESCKYAHYMFSGDMVDMLPEVRAGNLSMQVLNDLLTTYPDWETMNFPKYHMAEFDIVSNLIADMQDKLQVEKNGTAVFKTRAELLEEQMSTPASDAKPMLVLKLDARATLATCGGHCGKADADTHSCTQCLQNVSTSWVQEPEKASRFLDATDAFVRLLELNKHDEGMQIVVSEAGVTDVTEAQMPYAKIELWFGRWPVSKGLQQGLVKMEMEMCNVTTEALGSYRTNMTWLAPQLPAHSRVEHYVVTSKESPLPDSSTTTVTPTCDEVCTVSVPGVADSVTAVCVASDAKEAHSVQYVCGDMKIKTDAEGEEGKYICAMA